MQKNLIYQAVSKNFGIVFSSAQSELYRIRDNSDQGCQFTSQTFVNFCKSNRVLQSMSKVGCPYDNAPMERFYNTLKQELIYRTSFVSEDALKEAINHYVFIWYNHIRPHSYNNGMTPWEARYSV